VHGRDGQRQRQRGVGQHGHDEAEDDERREGRVAQRADERALRAAERVREHDQEHPELNDERLPHATVTIFHRFPGQNHSKIVTDAGR
jgi:hypothetical protein